MLAALLSSGMEQDKAILPVYNSAIMADLQDFQPINSFQFQVHAYCTMLPKVT